MVPGGTPQGKTCPHCISMYRYLPYGMVLNSDSLLLTDGYRYGTVPGELDMAIRRSLQGELDKRVAGGEARDDGLKKSVP